MMKDMWLRTGIACFLAFAGTGCRSVDIESAQRKVVESWDRGTGDPRSEIRVLSTTWIGLYAELSLGYLDRMLDDPDPEVRRSAVARLTLLSEALNGYLKRALSNPSTEVRTTAHREMVAVGASVRNEVALMKDRLREALRHPDASERRWAAWIVANNQDYYEDAVDAECLPAVVEASKDPEWFLRIWAVKKLGDLGPGAVPRLTEVLDDPEPRVREAAERALEQLR